MFKALTVSLAMCLGFALMGLAALVSAFPVPNDPNPLVLMVCAVGLFIMAGLRAKVYD